MSLKKIGINSRKAHLPGFTELALEKIDEEWDRQMQEEIDKKKLKGKGRKVDFYNKFLKEDSKKVGRKLMRDTLDTRATVKQSQK